jgi:hypothetical protein
MEVKSKFKINFSLGVWEVREIKRKARLVKGRNIHIFSGNEWRFWGNLGSLIYGSF